VLETVGNFWDGYGLAGGHDVVRVAAQHGQGEGKSCPQFWSLFHGIWRLSFHLENKSGDRKLKQIHINASLLKKKKKLETWMSQ
jgi:hypothetical protein